MKKQRYTMIKLDYYCQDDDNVFYDVFVDVDGRHRQQRIRTESFVGRVVYNLANFLLETILAYQGLGD